MNPQFRDIAQQHLTSYIAPRTRTDGGYASGGSDALPPMSPVEFAEILLDETKSFKPNKWDLESIEQANLIDLAVRVYTTVYSDWARLPVATDAPQAVVDWWKSQQAT